MHGELEFEKELMEKVNVENSIKYLDAAIDDIHAGKLSRLALSDIAEDALFELRAILWMMQENDENLTVEHVALRSDLILSMFYEEVSYFKEVEEEQIAKYEQEEKQEENL